MYCTNVLYGPDTYILYLQHNTSSPLFAPPPGNID